MLRICIVEDNQEDVQALIGLLSQYQDKCGMEVRTTVYHDALAFLDSYQGNFDIVFMDIDMPMLNGMQAAEKLRTIDKAVILVFVTNLESFVIKGYTVEAYDYIVKPIQYNHFFALMKRIGGKLKKERQCKYLFIKTGEDRRRIDCREIEYIEVCSHLLYIHTESGVVTVWSDLASIGTQLPEDFVRCHRSYIVNLQFIDRLKDNTIVIREGEEIPIGRKYREEIVQKVLNFYR